MPSRLMTAAILAFWLGMTGLLIHYEVMPMMLDDASPTYQPDITDEIGAPLIAWHVKHKGKRAGSATSRIVARPDRSYEFYSTFHLDRALFQAKQVESIYRIGENGKLKALSLKFVVHADAVVEIRGEVVGQKMEPHVFINDVEEKGLELGNIDMNQQGDAINAMSLVGRLRGLHEGQTWKITMLDLSRGVNLPFLAQMRGPSALIAVAHSDTLTWNKQEVACYKIEYHETGKDVTARTWVRKADGMVLQQESAHLGFDMVVERVP